MGEIVELGHEVMGLWKPEGVGNDPPSTSIKRVEMSIWQTDHQIVMPVFTCTKVFEVKALLATRIGCDPDTMKFTHKQGSIFRENRNCEEIARKVVIKGIKSFNRQKKDYDHPHAVIGAGHIGLKVAMTWLMEKPAYTNFVVVDMRDKVGGTSWLSQANTTSRLQTEVGVYHLEYHENNGWPEDCRVNPWPSRDQLLERFQKTSEEFGILPYVRLNTHVTKINVLGREDTTYELTMNHMQTGQESTMIASSVMMFPGNLTLPKKNWYKGEDEFDGDIVYGICNAFDYGKAKGQQVSIIGSGAFAVENIRTCVENQATKVYMICRRKTLSMPRVVSWLANQSVQFVSAALTMEAMSPMYDLIGVDQWGYYSVFANEAKTTVTIKQKSRFGIGDVYFLCMHYGHVEHIVDDVKRLSRHTVHLVNGRRIDDVPIMLKLLGFNGEFEHDRLLRIKELYGWWVNKDPKRYIVAEPLGVDANNFAGTSFSPGAINWSETQVHFLHYPKDFDSVIQSGLMPTHVADETIDRPAYVVEARHGSSTSICLGACVQGLAERGMVVGPLKHTRMHQMHPVDSFLEAAKKEWDNWSKTIRDLGYTHVEHPEYPYTEEIVKGYIAKEHEAYAAAMARAQR